MEEVDVAVVVAGVEAHLEQVVDISVLAAAEVVVVVVVSVQRVPSSFLPGVCEESPWVVSQHLASSPRARLQTELPVRLPRNLPDQSALCEDLLPPS